MTKYLCQYIPNLSDITAPLRHLTRLDSDWQWHSEHDASVAEIKNRLTKAPVLGIYDSSKPLTLQADSSKNGLGASILQDGHPLAFASRSLTPSEERYAQIEKELLAILFGIEKFHQYTYGRPIDVLTDHKPLVAIFNKGLDKISARLQRMLLRLLKYNLNVSYLPGKEMYVADTLSRAYIKDPVTDDPDITFVVHTVVKHLPMTPERKAEFQSATKTDACLANLAKLYQSGWPKFKSQVPQNVKYYWNLKDDISEIEGLLFLNERLIVPESLRTQMLHLIHEGHSGIERCKIRARSLLFWPNMSVDIELLVKRCQICSKYQKSNVKEPMIPHAVPDRAWEKVGTDILQFAGKDYLVVTDYYSKWLELVSIPDKTAFTVIHRLKSLFARYGIPDTVCSDNMPFFKFRV